MRITSSMRSAGVPCLAVLIVGLGSGLSPAKAQAAASALNERAVDAAVTKILQSRADRLTGSPVRLGRDVSVANSRMRAFEQLRQDRLDALSDRLARVNGGFSRATVVVNVESVEVESVEAESAAATARVRETTSLFYRDREPGAPASEDYSVLRDVTMVFEGGRWVVASEQLVDPAGLPPITDAVEVTPATVAPADPSRPSAETKRSRPAGKSPAKPSGPQAPALTATYDYSAMVDYANRYWATYNSAYRAYGNDCTNFISQAMRAGGWSYVGSGFFDRTDNSKWFYGSFTWTTSYSWAGAENWWWFAQYYSGRTSYLSNVWYLLYADVLQADFDRDNNIDHTMIVTYQSSGGEPYLTYHTTNTHNKRLSTMLAQYPSAWWYAHRT